MEIDIEEIEGIMPCPRPCPYLAPTLRRRSIKLPYFLSNPVNNFKKETFRVSELSLEI